MTKVVVLLFCLVSSVMVHASTRADANNQTIVGVISGVDKAVYESKLDPLLKEQLRNCGLCSVRNFTPYDAQGKVDTHQIASALEQARSSSSFIFLNWNEKAEGNSDIVDGLKKITTAGVVVIASAGAAQENQNVLPLGRTVVGQVPGVVIIGELMEKESLLTKSYFGPQMLTALKPPKEYVGQGVSSLFFVSKLATHWSRKSGSEWLNHFQTTKAKTRRLWPEVDDFFGR